MKREKRMKIFYNPIDGSAPLSIYWFKGPKGDAVEADNENGVGFFSPSCDLLGVIFDDVQNVKDQQKLFFSNGAKISISVRNGQVKVTELILPEQRESA